MIWDPTLKPRLRPIEAFPIPGEEASAVALIDPSGFSDVMLTVSPAALQLLALMDGRHSCDEIRAAFLSSLGQALATDTLLKVLSHLDQALLLDNGRFAEHYSLRLGDYRLARKRLMREPAMPDLENGPARLFDAFLAEQTPIVAPADVAGLIAPHLDYPRGRPCYAAAYAQLIGRPSPDRVVILGTNHFGRAALPVATASDFVTPLGTSAVDLDFLAALEQRAGDLREFELDHVREHSVELQVLWLQYLFGPETFRIVPILCPDPCTPDGMAAEALCSLAASMSDAMAQGGDTLIVAGADLSHVGEYFGDDRPLGPEFLSMVEGHDREALNHLADGEPARFAAKVADG